MNTLEGVMVVGLTGQTGAGKSTVSKVFKSGGFAVIDADHVARAVVEKDMPCLKELTDYFGTSVLNDDSSLNRKALAKIVFTDRTKLEVLNSIIYPYITGEILKQIREHSVNGEKLILLDAPTLFESRADDFCEIIISGDSLTREQARERMNSQLDEEFFRTHSDYIISNNGPIETVNAISKELADKIKDYYHKQINPLLSVSG